MSMQLLPLCSLLFFGDIAVFMFSLVNSQELCLYIFYHLTEGTLYTIFLVISLLKVAAYLTGSLSL
jgi:hypothetical protein